MAARTATTVVAGPFGTKDEAAAYAQLRQQRGVSRPGKHTVTFRIVDGEYLTVASVDCPDAHLGAARPCAVWADFDATTRLDECSVQHYVDALGVGEGFFHGQVLLPPIPVRLEGSGEDFHVVLAPEHSGDSGSGGA